MSNATQTVTLTEFLLARIAEDEKMASGGESWSPDSDGNGDPVVAARGHDGSLFVVAKVAAVEDAVLIAHHNPARVLAECEAKRFMVATYVGLSNPAGLWDRLVSPTVRVVLETVMREMAAVYAEHPDYRDDLAV